MAARPIVEVIEGSSMSVSLVTMVYGVWFSHAMLTHCGDIIANSVAKGKVASDCHENVEECGGADTSDYHGGGPEVRIIG